MSLLTELKSKGVSQIGAVETLLGLPLSRATDRTILAKMSLPLARESLRQPTALRQAGPDQLMALLMAKASGDQNAAAALTSIRTDRQRAENAEADRVRKQRIQVLRTNIQNTEREIERLTIQLLGMPVPPRNVPPQVWEANVRLLRGLIKSLRKILAGFVQQLAELTGTSGEPGGARGAAPAGSLSQSQSNAGDVGTKKSNSQTGGSFA